MLAPLLAAALLVLPAPVTLDGVGRVVPGLTATQVSARWGVAVRPGGGAGLDCTAAPVRHGGVDGSALFVRGRLGSVFFDRGVRTPSGIGIGSTLAAIRRVYGSRLEVRPHKYVPGGKYLFLTRARAPHWRIRFDTNGRGRVVRIGFGARPSIEWVEGCS